MSAELEAAHADIAVHALLEDAPCDDCRQARRCAFSRLACAAFAMYTEGRGGNGWRNAPRIASRHRFNLLFAEAPQRRG